MALESSLWAWLKKARVQCGDALHMERIEDLFGGIPDVEGYLHLNRCQGQFWLELKSKERPWRETTPIRFPLKKREKQIEFMGRRWAVGGNAFWLLQVGSGGHRRLYLAPGDMGPILANGLPEFELANHCEPYGYFGNKVSPVDILGRVVTCRKERSISTSFPPPNFDPSMIN